MVLIGLAFLFALSLEGAWRGICKLRDMGKQWVVAIDEDAKVADLKRLRVRPEWIIDAKAGKAYAPAAGGSYDATSSARMGYGSKWGKLYFFDAIYGHALRAPSSSAMQKGLESRGVFLPVDASAIYRKLHRNVKQDMVDPQAHIRNNNTLLIAAAAIMGVLIISMLVYLVAGG